MLITELMRCAMVMVVMSFMLMVFMVPMMVLLMVVVIIVLVFLVMVVSLEFLNPGCRRGNLLEIKLLSMNQLIKRHVAIVALNDVGLGLNSSHNLTHLGQLLLADFRNLVQQNHITELYLLDNQVLNVLLIDVLAQQVVATGKFVTHAQHVDNSNNAV